MRILIPRLQHFAIRSPSSMCPWTPCEYTLALAPPRKYNLFVCKCVPGLRVVTTPPAHARPQPPRLRERCVSRLPHACSMHMADGDRARRDRPWIVHADVVLVCVCVRARACADTCPRVWCEHVSIHSSGGGREQPGRCASSSVLPSFVRHECVSSIECVSGGGGGGGVVHVRLHECVFYPKDQGF